MIYYINYHNNNMSIECQFKIIILLLFFIITYLFFITIICFSVIFSTLVNWNRIFEHYTLYIDYVKEIVEKMWSFICQFIKKCCFAKEIEKEIEKEKSNK